MTTTDLPARTAVLVVGTGFAGLGTAVRLRERGRLDFVVIERGHDVGGTWRDNSYPGCACDVPSHMYSFSFAPNPHWTRAFSPQPEIQAYLQRVARERGVLPHVRFGTELLVGPLGRGRRGLDRRDEPRHRRRGRARPRHRRAVRPRAAGGARPRPLHRHDLPLRHLGPRPRPDRASGSPSSAPAPRRSSSCRTSSAGPAT